MAEKNFQRSSYKYFRWTLSTKINKNMFLEVIVSRKTLNRACGATFFV